MLTFYIYYHILNKEISINFINILKSLMKIIKKTKKKENAFAKGVAKRKARIITAMIKHKGLVSYACKEAKVSRITYYKYYKFDALFRKVIDEIEDTVLDVSESALHGLIAKKEPSAVYFHLKCKGKKRGYVERKELEVDVDVKRQKVKIGGQVVEF